MNKDLQHIEFLFPREPSWGDFNKLQAEEPFSENAISFINALAVTLRHDLRLNNFPEIATFAFFCRRSNLVQLKKIYYPQNNMRKGRGIAFHISPSNMPLNFAYSLVSGILSGNLNIVRLPSKNFKQVDIILQAIRELSEKSEFKLFTQRMLLVRYDRSSSAMGYFSSICHARIIWGGNPAVQEIQKNTLPANAIDIAFADKYSICIINADKYIHEGSPEEIARLFYNDTFLFDQNACTSPHLIVWLGNNENVSASKKIFWDNLHRLVKERYDFQPHSAIDKLAAFYGQAIHLNEIKKNTMPDNLIWRIELNELPANIDQHRCNCGYFAEYTAVSLSELSTLISKKHQTIGYYGMEPEAWTQLSMQTKLNVVERAKPIGTTSEFSLTWDGCNLIESLSKPFYEHK